MKTTVSISESVFRAAERLARRLGISRSSVYSHAIEPYVVEAQELDVMALLNEVYAQETAGLGLDPALRALQSASMPRDAW
jgi:hypothetical protein